MAGGAGGAGGAIKFSYDLIIVLIMIELIYG